MTTNNVANAANQPRPRKAWIDKKTGKRKGAFWQFRFGGRYITLTAYGAPQSVTGKNGSKAERNAAIAARDKYLAEQEKARHTAYLDSQRPHKGVTVGDVITPYINQLLPASKRSHGKALQSFLDGKTKESYGIKAFRGVGHLAAHDLTFKHIDHFVAAHPNWSDVTRDDRIKMIKAALNWGMSDKGGKLIDRHPLQTWQVSSVAGVRKSYFTREDEELFKKYCPTPLRLVVEVCIELGLRPSEAMKVTTNHVKTTHDGIMYWQLEPNEWKNGRKTKKPRVIPITPKWEHYTKKVLAKSSGRTHLFVNSYGGPWRTKASAPAIRAARERCYKAERENMTAEQRTKFYEATDGNELIVLYSARHTFITRALIAGESAYRVATVCGTSEAMIRKTYSHVLDEHDVLRAVVMSVQDRPK